MEYIKKLKEKINGDLKKIVLPESNDERILQATKIIEENHLAEIILIGKDYLDPEKYDELDTLINKMVEIRKGKITALEAKELLINDYMYFAVMLVACDKADGVVSGAAHTTADTFRPALQLLKTEEKASSFFIIDTPIKEDPFIFADCGLIQNPTSEELSIIAKESYESYKALIGNDPHIAMLSHSTIGSAKGELVDKVKDATDITKKKYKDIDIVGEIQLDAALNKDIAKSKGIESGNANILIFPNIDAGNIAYKLMQIFGNSKCYGPLIQGLKKPVNNLSRGFSVEDIVGSIIITVYQAQKNC